MFRRRQRSVSLQPEPAPLSLASPGYDVPAQFNHNHLYQRYHQQPRHQVSPQHHRHRRRLTTIGDLPFEILQLIFREILEDPRRVKSVSRPYELKLNFPYNVAFTCKGWSVIAFRMAELWTNIRVYLGYHGRLTPLRSLQAQLRASGSQTINAWIKMARDPTLDDPIARHDANSNFPIQHMIHDVFQMLSQHAQRIDAIYINNSSNGQYNSDGGNAYSPCGNFSWVGSRRTTHPFASLSEVVLDGASFLDVCSVRNFWASTRMSRLGIRHLHVRDQSYSMRQLICHLATIPCLTALEFEDIYIADMCGAAAAGPSISDASGHDILRTVTTLAFIKVEEQFIRSLYANASALPFADVHFHECDRLRLDHDLEIHAKNIHLNDMHGSAFRRLVRQFTGRGIYIDNCNALDDQFLHQLADAVQRDPRIMSFLDFLSIDDCQNFTFAAFSRFLQAVTTQTGRRQKVALHCMGVPRISGREKQWLKQMTERPCVWNLDRNILRNCIYLS